MTHRPPHSPLASPRDDQAAPVGLERQLERRLPSGRSLTLRTDAGGEEIEIRSRRGEVELRITLTDAGPVVTLGGGRLEVESTDVVFRCQTFAVQATQDLSLTSGRDVRIRGSELHAQTEQDIHLNGAYIRLNCTPDAPVPLSVPELGARSEPPCCADEQAGHREPSPPPPAQPPTS